MEASLMGGQIRTKIEQLEVALAKIAHTKQQLRDNADLLKGEIRDCFGTQLAYLRGREAQLLQSLEAVATVKEELLAQQQDSLHQALGAAHQSLRCLRAASEAPEGSAEHSSLDTPVQAQLSETLRKLAGLELTPREGPDMAFAADAMALRRALHSFGRIVSAPQHPGPHNQVLRTGSGGGACLPGDMEDYEDESSMSVLSHKWLGPSSTLGSWSAVRSSARDSVSSAAGLWTEALTADPPGQPMDAPLRRTLSDRRHKASPSLFGGQGDLSTWLARLSSEEEGSGSSFELVGCPAEASIRAYFDGVAGQPDGLWLMDSAAAKDAPTTLHHPSEPSEQTEEPSDMDEAAEGQTEGAAQDHLSMWLASDPALSSSRRCIFERAKESLASGWLAGSRQASLDSATPPLYASPPKNLASMGSPADPADDLHKWLHPASAVQGLEAQMAHVRLGIKEGQEAKDEDWRRLWLANGAEDDRQLPNQGAGGAEWETALGWAAAVEAVHSKGDRFWLHPSADTTLAG